MPEAHRAELRADCEHCFALCCVVPAFSASADFALDKSAGQPCAHLRPDFRCSVHEDLRQRGFAGCTVYDCFGAGQRVSQVTFGGRDWRSAPEIAPRMFEVFPIMRHLHELLWYLHEALGWPAAAPIHAELGAAIEETERLTHWEPGTLATLDVTAHRQEVNVVLMRASELARAGRRGAELRGADLIGKDFQAADLRGANLRGAYLVGTDLRGADLRTADVIGADFRGSDLRGADLTTSLFLVQPQLDAAKGDRTTKVPPSLALPSHWTG
jgi:uncharacterized protein YjbI with pentapeptide repeats